MDENQPASFLSKRRVCCCYLLHCQSWSSVPGLQYSALAKYREKDRRERNQVPGPLFMACLFVFHSGTVPSLTVMTLLPALSEGRLPQVQKILSFSILMTAGSGVLGRVFSCCCTISKHAVGNSLMFATHQCACAVCTISYLIKYY